MARQLVWSFLIPLAVSLSPVPLWGQSDPDVDTRLVPADTFFAMVVHPRQIAQSANRENEDVRYLSEKFNGWFGWSLDQLDELLICVGTAGAVDEDGSVDTAESVCAIFRFAQDVDAEEILETMFKHGYRETEFHGKSYLEPLEPYAPCGYSPNARTIVLAEPDRLLDVLENEGTMSHGAALVKQLKQRDDFRVVIEMGAQGEDAALVLEQTLQDFEISEGVVETLVDGMLKLDLQFRITDSVPANFVVTFTDPESAQTGGEAARQFEETIKQGLQEMKHEIGELPDELEETLEDLVELVDKAFDNMDMQVKDNRLTARVQYMGGFPQAADIAAGMLAGYVRIIEEWMDIGAMDQ